nr:MAG TPA: PsbA, PsbB, PsbC, PsbD, PsbE-FCP supercomplex, PLANT PROTEIN [Microviridae sp.]
MEYIKKFILCCLAIYLAIFIFGLLFVIISAVFS